MRKVIADSSFYICFLDDIKKPKYLIRIIKSFEFLIGKIVKEEVERSKNYRYLEDLIGNQIRYFKYENYGELLKPFFSLDEIKRGEHEVIAMTVILVRIEITSVILVIDDIEARKFVKNNFPNIYEITKYTVEFIKECWLKYKVFSKSKTIEILTLIKTSKFRIKKEIIEDILHKIVRC